MGRYQEAKDLITGSYEELNKAGVLVGESQYYLALLPLLVADSEEAIAQADPMLMQVGLLVTSFSMAITHLVCVEGCLADCTNHSLPVLAQEAQHNQTFLPLSVCLLLASTLHTGCSMPIRVMCCKSV